MRRLLIYTPAPATALQGEFHTIEHLAAFVNALGRRFAVTLVTPPEPEAGAAFRRFLSGGRLDGSIRVRPFKGRGRLRHLRQLGHLLCLIRGADLVYLFSGHQAFLAGLANLIWRRPLFLYLNCDRTVDTLRHHARWPRCLRSAYAAITALLERMLIHQATLTYYHGEHLAQRHRGQGRLRAVIPLLDLTAAHFSLGLRDGTRSPARLLYVGGLGANKGSHLLPVALRRLVDRGRNVTLTVVSKGNPDAEFVRQISDHKLGDRLRVIYAVPWGPKLLQFYRDADVFVFPSIAEGFPRVLYEAMSQGLPIVTTAVGGVPHLLRHAREAEFVRADDPGDLARGIDRVLTDRAYRTRLATNAYQLAWRILVTERKHRDHAAQFEADLHALGLCKEGRAA